MSEVRTAVWAPVWHADRSGQGVEHVFVADRSADGLIVAFDEAGSAYRLAYQLSWDEAWRLRGAYLAVTAGDAAQRTLRLVADGRGGWAEGGGHPHPELGGCLDIDIWPSAFTNTFPVHRLGLAEGERREIAVAFVEAPALAVSVMRQAYTRLDERRFRFESLDGSGFSADITVDQEGLVEDYPGFFSRLA